MWTEDGGGHTMLDCDFMEKLQQPQLGGEDQDAWGFNVFYIYTVWGWVQGDVMGRVFNRFQWGIISGPTHPINNFEIFLKKITLDLIHKY